MEFALGWLTEMYDTRMPLLLGIGAFLVLTAWSIVWLNRYLKNK